MDDIQKGVTRWIETDMGIIPRDKLLMFEIEGLRRGHEYIIKNYHSLEITHELVLKLHMICFGWIFPDWAGELRKINVRVSDHAPPQYFEVPVNLKNLLEDYKVQRRYITDREEDFSEFLVDMAELVAWFQHKFVWIHPFKDYNGRIARLLSNLILLKFDLPIIKINADSGKDRSLYVMAMQKADKGNLLPLSVIVSESMAEALQCII